MEEPTVHRAAKSQTGLKQLSTHMQEGQRSLACYGPRGLKELHTT